MKTELGEKEAVIQQFLAELSRSSEQVRRHRAFYARKFLDFIDVPLHQWNKDVVLAWLDSLRGEGYAAGSVRECYAIAKRVFDAARAVYDREKTMLISEVDPGDPTAVARIMKAMSLPPPTWDLGKRGAPRVSAEDVVKPAATLEEIAAMVEAAKAGVLSPAERAYLALSTVYGLRREELCRVMRDDLDFAKGTIYVRTAKNGEQREQLLCEEVVPYLRDYSFSEGYSPRMMSGLYWKICYKAGVNPPKASGWHSPRRFLDTVLFQIFGELTTHIFLRWKISSSSLMTERYFSEDPLEVDRRVLEQHPVVSLWR